MFVSFSEASSLSGEASLWLQNTFAEKNCENLNSKDVGDLKKIINCDTSSTHKLPQSKSQFNQIAEHQYFQQLAGEHYKNLTCQKQQTELIKNDEELVKEFAADISKKLPFLKEQRKLSLNAFNDYQYKLNKANQFYSYCRQSLSTGSKDKCFSELKQLQNEENQALQKWQQHESAFKATQASLWQGTSQEMQRLVQDLSRQDPLPNSDQVLNSLKASIPKVQKEIADALQDFEKQSTTEGGDRNFNKLSDLSKRQLLESEAHQTLLTTATQNRNEAFLKLNCRLEGQYTKGRDKLENTIMGATFLLGGAAGLLSKIPVATRASTLAQFSLKSQNAGKLLGYLAVGFDATLVAQSIQKSCLSDSISSTAKNSCTSDKKQLRQQQLQQLETDNCILTAALDLAPAGLLTGSVAYRALKKNLAEYSNLRNELGPNSTLKDLAQKDAKKMGNKINARISGFEPINAEIIKTNRINAETYIAKNGLPLKPVRKKVEPDTELIEIYRHGTIQKAEEISQLEKNSKAQIQRLINQKEPYTKELQELKLELSNLEKAKDPSTTAEKRLQLKQKIAAYEEFLKEDFDDKIEKIKNETVLQKATLEKELAKLENQKRIHESVPLIKTEFPSSIDSSAQRAAAEGILNQQDMLELGKSTNDRNVYRFTAIPKASSRANGTSPFWQHPQFAERMKELQNMGVEVIVDPQKTKGAHYSPHLKAIYLKEDADYHLFEHEFTHAQFDNFVADKIVTQFSNNNANIKSEFRNGAQVERRLSQEQIQRLGEKNVQQLQELVTKYYDPLTVNESLAVKKQLDALGWRPLSSEYHWTKIYGSYYRVNELMLRKSYVEKNPGDKHFFSSQDKKLLDQELTKMGQDIAMMRGTRAAQERVSEIRTQIQKGQTAQALATYRALSSELDKSTSGNDTQLIFNGKGDILRFSEKGKKIEVLPSK
ncbi:MAG: hypothetical protein ACLGGX_01200 [Bdellovibrionia bacterium]